MDPIVEILDEIMQLKGILEQVNFKVYFDPGKLNQVDGVEKLVPLSSSLSAHINAISIPAEDTDNPT